MKKTLIIVDVQYDFYDPKGSLYVKGGEEIIPEIKNLIETDGNIDQIIFTVDWHLPEDRSFSGNGGSWPFHCVQHTLGSTIHQDLINACINLGYSSLDYVAESGEGISPSGTYDVFKKGDSPYTEEYGAFVNYSYDPEKKFVCLTNMSDDSNAYIPDSNGIIICGLAGDYCVLKTLENLIRIPELEKYRFEVFSEGIRSIDGGKKLSEFVISNGLKYYGKGI